MYSEKLIKEVKECYPDCKKIHQMVKGGDVLLGRYLDDCCDGGIPLNTILAAVTLEELKEKARLEKRKLNCYKMWYNEIREKI